MRFVLTALVSASLAVPATGHAQETAAQETEALETKAPERDFSALAEELQDPDKQREMAMMLRTVSDVLLDLPLAPLMEAVNDVAKEAGDTAVSKVDPDATLRQLAPQTNVITDQIEENLPRALDAMGSMVKAFDAMMPTLQHMAERMKDAVPPARQE